MKNDYKIPGFNLEPRHLEILKTILAQMVPQAEVWAYGSRVNGDGHDSSDIDLVLRNPPDLKKQQQAISDLKDALSESDIPLLVDVLDWALLPPEFHQEIEKAFVVIQSPS